MSLNLKEIPKIHIINMENGELAEKRRQNLKKVMGRAKMPYVLFKAFDKNDGGESIITRISLEGD